MNPDILDEQGKPIPKRDAVTTRGVRWLGANWRVWVPIGISFIALLISGWSASLSTRNSEVTRRLSKLGFRPVLRLETLLRPAGKSLPHWQLTNTGPLEAVQIKVQMILHRYFPETKMVQGHVTATWNTSAIPKLEPQETKAYAFREGFLETESRIQNPPQYNIMEILLTYRRPQDLKEYSESAYYFVNPNGLWVHEEESSLKGELYESMRAALVKMDRLGPVSVYREWPGDPLHRNE
jgi:hypothetical protein